MKKKLVAVVLLSTVFGAACASTQGPKKDAYVALSAVKEALNLVQITTLKAECGKVGAPIEPACVPHDLANDIHKKIAEGAKLGEQAAAALRALPPTLDGSTPATSIAEFTTKIWLLIHQIVGLFPNSDGKLNAQVQKLEAK